MACRLGYRESLPKKIYRKLAQYRPHDALLMKKRLGKINAWHETPFEKAQLQNFEALIRPDR